MPGLWVLLDVVVDPECRQGLVKLLGGPAQIAILASEAADDWTGSLQGGFSVCVRGRRHAVVHARCRQPWRWRKSWRGLR
jgi:hypothetical protein